MTVSRSRVAETLGAGVVGAMLGGVTGRLVGWRSAGALIGAANGLIGGWRQIYRLRDARGVFTFGVDSTWALATTAAGLFSHLIAAVGTLTGRPARYCAALSERQGRHVYSGGFRPRSGFVVTLGNVVSGAGDLEQARSVKLVTDHEQIHINQARALGPLYPVVYGGSMAVGALVGMGAALMSRIRPHTDQTPPPRVFDLVETYAYYCNPCEWWAYSRDGNWPPPGKLPGRGWTRPIVKPLHSDPSHSDPGHSDQGHSDQGLRSDPKS
jgi:hypothetical protein